jgi:hypothetical protein
MSVMRTILVLGLMSLFMVGCDWTTGGDGYGSRVDINFSGTYNGQQSGRAVSNIDGRPISRLVITQVGDTVDVFDNNGGRYRGRISQANTVTQAAGDSFAAGTQLAQAQVSWSGVNPATGREARFVGNISAVAVRDIRSNSSGTTSNTSDIRTSTQSSTSADGSTITQVQTEIGFDPLTGLENFRRETVRVIDAQTGSEISRTTSTEGGSTQNTAQEFAISAQNTQYLLEGNWIESGGPTGYVRALAAGSAGTIGSGGGGNSN